MPSQTYVINSTVSQPQAPIITLFYCPDVTCCYPVLLHTKSWPTATLHKYHMQWLYIINKLFLVF